ncbi:MAG: hypothetical protein INF43_03545 [Alphaproteobacteria bacterium]|jgi:hypothetical protein|nr:hypothetical protein [Alphaproteobacteria bacterium]
MTRRNLLWLGAALALAACNNLSMAQRESPANAYKDYRTSQSQNAVIGVGEPISARQAAANATLTMSGEYFLEEVMQRVAGTYNLAVRWGNGVQQDRRQEIVIKSLTFDEARNYIEDVYGVQIIKEGERRLLVLPSAAAPRLTEFAPGNNVTLAQALRGLAEQCNSNLIINENKNQLNSIRVTTRLRDITCHEAYEALLTPHGLSAVQRGDYITVGGLPQRQWTVNLFEPVRNEDVEVSYSSDFSAGSSDGESDSGGGGMTAGGTNKVKIKYERNLWKDMETDLKELVKNSCSNEEAETVDTGNREGQATPTQPALLPPPNGAAPADAALMTDAAPNSAAPATNNQTATTQNESSSRACGYVRVNPSVGLVQMRAAQSVLEEANEIIQRTENIANRRIMLEARVLAVSRNRNFDQKGSIRAANANPGDNSFGFGAPGSIASTLSTLLTRNAVTGFGAEGDATLGGFRIANNNLDAVVGLLERYSTTYQLMHPVMELMDRQRATLIDGTNEKYFIVKSTTTTGTATSTASDVEERSQFLGLQFSASAQIADDPSEPHTISLQIPITSSDRNVRIPGGVSGTDAGVAPIANTRLIDQKVRIRDGEIKAIGGLTTTVATDAESGLPIFRDIPLVGKLGNEENIAYRQVEFVILLQVRRLN